MKKRTYIISYDLRKPGRNYEEVLRVIKSYSAWARLGSSAYLVITTKKPDIIRDEFMSFFGF